MKKDLIILAIETSCDETAAAVIKNGKVFSNIIASQANIHAKYGGVVPEVAARSHITAIIPVINQALKSAGTKVTNVDYVAVTQGPGLMTSLMVGVETARSLSFALNKPVVAINHLEAHIYANFAQKQEWKFPALVLTVSGGHTMLVLMQGHGKLKIIGETVDDAAGEAFDKTAKLLGLGYPGGPLLSKLAVSGNPEKFKFPRPMMKNNDLNFSFSGLKTSVLYEIQKHKKLSQQQKADFSASIETAIVDVLINKLHSAIKKYQPKTIMLGGGVAANKPLRERFEGLAKFHKLKYSIPEFQYCTDNAAMVGLTAYYRILHKKIKPQTNFVANPQLELK